MTKLIKYLKPYIGMVFLILVALGVQAYCDLSLPTYTSNIVNIGVQQHGILEKVPYEITEEDMGVLLTFTPDKSKEYVRDAYETKKDHVLKIKSSYKEGKKHDKLADILKTPMFIGVMMKEETLLSKNDDAEAMKALANPEALHAAVESGKLQEEIHKKLAEVPDTILDQATFAYIEQAYENANVDIDHIQNTYIVKTGLKMLAFAGAGMIAAILVGFMAARTGAGIGRDLRNQVFNKVVSFSNAEFDRFSTASLITRSTNDVQQVQMITTIMLRMVLYSPIMAAGGIWKVFQTNVDMVWIIGVGVVALFSLVLTLMITVMPKFKIVQNLLDKINLVSREILSGLQVIRAFGTQRHEEKRFDDANKDFMRVNLFVNRAMTFMMPLMMLIMNGVTVLIVWNGAHGIENGSMQVGDMIAFIQYTMQIIMSFLMLTMISVMLPRAAVAAKRIDEVMTSETSINDIHTPETMLDSMKGIVEFEGVSFRYPGASEDVIHDISFRAERGKTTAIIGSTGSGKTTLINLIPRFYDATQGEIRVGGHNIKNVAQHDLRERIGLVPQKGVLFSGDIASNILYSNPNESKDTMINAARIAQAQEFINTGTQGYERHISQGGTNVSGGQKQRLSIARAVAKNPDIYIFDDSFSALDFKTDLSLRKALKEYTQEATVIIVAQRISTILNAEQILVLDEGKIVGKGTHKELLKSCEEYYQIASSQLSEEELEADLQEVK